MSLTLEPLALVADVGAGDDEPPRLECSARRERGPHRAPRVPLEDVADERTPRVYEAARSEAFDEPCQTLAERRNARGDGVGERLVARARVSDTCLVLPAQDVCVAQRARDPDDCGCKISEALV